MAIVTPLESAPGARRRLALANPATLEPIGEIEVQAADDVRAAVMKARETQPEWAASSFDMRATVIRRALRILLDRQDEFIDLILSETGKARSEALQMEIYAACDSLNYYARRAGKILKPRRERLHGMFSLLKQLHVVYRPLGVVGVISPWNGPFILAINPCIQALMAGNAVILKPSEVTPFSGKLVGDLFDAAELPAGLLQVMLGDGETGAELTRAGVDKISFTGSVATGREVAVACAEQLIPCTLELGGKDAMIVCGDADLDNAAGGAVAGAFMNTGQYCCGTERVYVVNSVADEFTRRVVERTQRLRQGAGGEFDVGAVFWPRQLEIIQEHVADAIEKGAKILCGGRRTPSLPGLFYEPTVLIDVHHDMQIMSDETFGPILPIMRVDDEETAIRMANDSDYGLGANVWTTNREKGIAMARRLESGSVCVNDMTMTYGLQEAPFGGVKQSGIGQVNGETGLKGYCHATPILVDRFGGRQTASRYPYTHEKDEGIRRFMRLQWGTALGRRLS
ncbi:MAG: aldehyde dehydrogenase family protein [Deltaproteobacteria bacterium]|nr:aldehyde dehydrogenase family protein [Deltaproteobacteria bacterium]MBW2392673.1 aldehyde dehydrogenase family protein [Deltaproteobacteria bacterium]